MKKWNYVFLQKKMISLAQKKLKHSVQHCVYTQNTTHSTVWYSLCHKLPLTTAHKRFRNFHIILPTTKHQRFRANLVYVSFSRGTKHKQGAFKGGFVVAEVACAVFCCVILKKVWRLSSYSPHLLSSYCSLVLAYGRWVLETVGGGNCRM